MNPGPWSLHRTRRHGQLGRIALLWTDGGCDLVLALPWEHTLNTPEPDGLRDGRALSLGVLEVGWWKEFGGTRGTDSGIWAVRVRTGQLRLVPAAVVRPPFNIVLRMLPCIILGLPCTTPNLPGCPPFSMRRLGNCWHPLVVVANDCAAPSLPTGRESVVASRRRALHRKIPSHEIGISAHGVS